MPTAKNKPKTSAFKRNIYLGLTLAFFLALIAVFVFDGYMGIYDTVTVITQEREETIEPEYWLRDGYSNYIWTDEGQDISFHYELENRCLSDYTADVEVAIWFGESKQSVVLTDTVAIGGFDSHEWDWVIDTATLRPADIPEPYDYEFSVIITRDGVELRTVVQVMSREVEPK
jgi:hypothetical protein